MKRAVYIASSFAFGVGLSIVGFPFTTWQYWFLTALWTISSVALAAYLKETL